MTREKMLDGALREIMSVLDAHPTSDDPYMIVDRREAMARARAALSAPEDAPAPFVLDTPKDAAEVLKFCRERHQQWCHLCEDFNCGDNTAPRCPQHPKEPTRRFGDLWRCSYCGEVVSPAPASPRPEEPGGGLTFDDALRIARGCLDYGGGYRSDDDKLAIYHHGIQTVINSLEAASKRGLADTQVRALHRMGAEPPPRAQPEAPEVKP